MTQHLLNSSSRRLGGSLSLAAIIGLAAISTSPSVSAITDEAVYTGSSCQPVTDTVDIRYNGAGEVVNSNKTTARTVVCGTRSDANFYTGVGTVAVRKHSTESMTCGMQYRSFDGTGSVSLQQTLSGTGIQYANFSIYNGYNSGRVNFSCKLPKASSSADTGVMSYYLYQPY